MTPLTDRVVAFSKPMLKQHFIAAASVIALIVGVYVDRRDPFTIIEGGIEPSTIQAGQTIYVTRHTDWRRRCDGYIFREVVGSDRLIRPYTRAQIRVPAQLGPQTVKSTFRAPLDLPAGETVYRAVVKFYECGVTSRFWPLEVEVPEVSFDAVAKP